MKIPRIDALDAFRGMTIAGMLLVNNPGTWAAIYPPLAHAEWHGWTPTDLIFPFFVFVVGITTHLSLETRVARGDPSGAITLGILRRGGLIILLGLLLQAFPFFPLERITELRFPGVLQRIGVCYIAAALLSRGRSSRAVAGMVAVLLLGYWALQALVAPPGVASPTLDVPGDTLSAWIDRVVFGGHLWKQSKTWDPEGLLSTLPAIGTCLLGVLAGRQLASGWPLSDRLNALFAAGGIGAVAGLMWNWVFPINKNLWTSSYVAFTAGFAAVLLAISYWIIDVRGWRGWTKPFVVLGANAITLFAASALLVKTMGLIKVHLADGSIVTLARYLYVTCFAPLAAPKNASLLYAIANLLILWALLAWMYRRQIFLRA